MNKDRFGGPWKFVRCFHRLKDHIFNLCKPSDSQFSLVQSSHLAGYSRELTRISIGGAIPHAIGRLGLVADRSLHVVCTD